MYYKLDIKAVNLAMIKKGYSVNQLSKESGIGNATLSRALRGITLTRPKTIYKLAKTLDIKVEDLLIEI